MQHAHLKTSAAYADIARIIGGRPAVSLSRLPAVWQEIAEGRFDTALTASQRRDYVEAAQLFAYHATPMAVEAMTAIGHSFAATAYPDLEAAAAAAPHDIARRTVAVLREIDSTLGKALPAAFYDLMLDVATRDTTDTLMDLFKDKAALMTDRLHDAVLHAVLLVTPVDLYVQSVFSRHGLRFTHVMNCGCNITASSDAAFTVTLDAELAPAYLQNVVAASFEQYGVNAATSKAARGF